MANASTLTTTTTTTPLLPKNCENYCAIDSRVVSCLAIAYLPRGAESHPPPVAASLPRQDSSLQQCFLHGVSAGSIRTLTAKSAIQDSLTKVSDI
jgi:hypothetical protein